VNNEKSSEAVIGHWILVVAADLQLFLKFKVPSLHAPVPTCTTANHGSFLWSKIILKKLRVFALS